MKKIFILLSVAFFGMFGAFAQAPVIYTKMTAAGYEFKYLKIDSGLLVPSRDTLVYRNANQPGIIVYKPGAGFFGYNGTNWRPLVGVDTTSLSNRINQKLNITDTANIRVRLSAGTNITSISGTYPNLTINAGNQSTDTSSLSNRINQKLNISDTANVRVRLSAGTNITSISGTYPNLTINAGNQSTDTSSLSNRINQKLDIVDTANIRVRLSAGTNITSISGTYPNLTINAGNQSTDTSSLSNRINQKLNIVDTANVRVRLSAGTNITSISGTYPNLTINAASSSIDTTNKWVTNVTTLTDSSFNVSRAGAVSTITIKGVTNAARMITTAYNKTGATITRGSVVYIDGAHSSILPSIALSKANQESTSAYTFGLVQDDITNNNSGIVVQAGTISNLNLPTSTYTDGQTLYLSPTIAGGYTTTKPSAPNHLVAIGTIVRAHPNLGTIQILIRNGTELAELADVQIAAVPVDSALLQFSRVDSLWHDVSPATALGNRAWLTGGNNTVNSNYFVGSINNASLRFKTFGEDRMILDSIGRLQINGLVNNTSYPNALQLANKNGRSIFDITTGGTVTNLTIKANNNAIGDSLVISDTGLIQSRSNTSIWLKGNTTGTGNVNVNAWRSASAGAGSIFSANVGTNAPIFNMLSTGQMSVGAETPVSTAALDITSTSRGLLIPRMTTTERNAISSPASQLLVANTTNKTVDMYNGTTWNTIAGGFSRSLTAYRLMGSTIQAEPIPSIALIGSANNLTSGRSYFNGIIVEKEITITGVTWYQNVQGAYTNINSDVNQVGLYSYSGGTLTLIDTSTRDNNIWKATTGSWGQKALANGTRTLQPGLYYIGALWMGSQTVFPSIGSFAVNAASASPLTTNSAKAWGSVFSGVSILPSTQAMSSLTPINYLAFGLY